MLTNDAGKYIFLDDTNFSSLINGHLNSESDIYKELTKRFFITSSTTDNLRIKEITEQIRATKAPLFDSTSLHIFVLTNHCNHRCIYCQASSTNTNNPQKHMSVDVALRATEIAFSSPSPHITIEFQGGEPLLNFNVLKYIVKLAQSLATKFNKTLSFNLVSNLSLLTLDKLEFLSENHISICTSIDGPNYIHDINRPSLVGSSHKIIEEKINMVKIYSQQHKLTAKIQAIQTTTNTSMGKAHEIIDEYVRLGVDTIFLRPLTPLGAAATNWDSIGYNADDFVLFYKQCIDYILELRKKGIKITEGHLEIL